MRTAFGIVLICLIAPVEVQAQSDARSCDADRERLAAVIEHAESKPPAAQFSDFAKFLDSVPDDPADCVSSAAIDRIAKAERRLVALNVGKQAVEPDLVFHCNHIDRRSAWCDGRELDTSALLPEEDFGTRQSRTVPAGAATAILHIDDGYSCNLTGVYGSSTVALQSGRQVVPLAHRQMTIELAKLPAKYSILIVTLSCKDKLRYRKLVWHLY